MARPKKVKEEIKKVEDVKVLPIPQLGKELDRFNGETFYIALHENGVLYHVYNSMDLIIRPNMTSGYETLADLVKNKEEYSKFTGKEKEAFELNMSAIAYILDMPLFCFSDASFCFDIASKIIEFLQRSFDKAMSMPLQEETVKEDIEFKEATLAIENIKEALNENVNS